MDCAWLRNMWALLSILIRNNSMTRYSCLSYIFNTWCTCIGDIPCTQAPSDVAQYCSGHGLPAQPKLRSRRPQASQVYRYHPWFKTVNQRQYCYPDLESTYLQ